MTREEKARKRLENARSVGRINGLMISLMGLVFGFGTFGATTIREFFGGLIVGAAMLALGIWAQVFGWRKPPNAKPPIDVSSLRDDAVL